MNPLYSFFATLENGWVNVATVVGAVVGISISIYAIWFSNKLSNESNEIANAIKDNTTSIKANTEAVQRQAEAIHNHTKILRLESLRNLYELSRGDESRHTFWHFKWRFETYDRIGATLYQVENGEEIYLGGCDLLIQGFSNPADAVGFEHRESDFYVAKVTEPVAAKGLKFPFTDGQKVACYDQEGQLMISLGVDPWETESSYRFSISGMGHRRSFNGPRTTETMPVFQRIKD